MMRSMMSIQYIMLILILYCYCLLQFVSTIEGIIIPKGKYDDTYYTGWKYSGALWHTYSSVSGAYDQTLHISNTIGYTASFTYNGGGFILYYRSCSICGKVDISIDGKQITTINQYSKTTIWKKTSLMSTVRSIGNNNNNNTHFVNLRHKSRSNITIDSIQIIGNGCSMFPTDNIWNTKIDTLPIHSRSSSWINSIGRNTGFHMDFGSGTWDGGPIGIPYNIIGSVTQQNITKYNVSFYYPKESDIGPYPIPMNPKREYSSDHHVLLLDSDTCTLYELFDASFNTKTNKWNSGSGAIWNLSSNTLRPIGWTSADAAGLPILPGLVLYEEILVGVINHAIRFTVSETNSYIWPARHLTSGLPNKLTNIPPMGSRFRLKSSFNISTYSPYMQVILTAMKLYGIILADNGSDWYISGSPDSRWDNDMLHLLDNVIGDDLEAVDVTSLIVQPNSGQCKK